jgi:penicillin G amidase
MWNVRLCAPALVAVVGLAIAGPAGARVIHAESVLPPGESGFVSSGGLGSGTGSPHLYDQQPLFIAFRRKSAQMGRPGTVLRPRPGVRIVRDAYGVPAVYGVSDADLWWGVGYAAAQDRLTQLEIFRASTTGHLAEILGRAYLASDIQARRDYYTPTEIGAMLRQLPLALQRRYTAYAAGINAWIAHVKVTPADLPGEFTALGVVPAPFSVEDLAAIGIQLARTTPNGDGTELDNVRALRAMSPAAFDRLEPLRVPGQITTIPASDGAFPSDPGRTRAQERAAFARSLRFVRGLPLPAPDASTSSADHTAPIHLGGSSAIAIGDRRTRHALLFSGPELGFSAPEELYEIEVHRPGLDARGVTAAGVPVVAIGHNAHVAWALTSGLSGTNSLYAERLVPGHPDEYLFRGSVRRMACRAEVFRYRSGSGQASETETLCRTVHGPVQERAAGVAYARRYATWMRELQTITGLAALDEAADIGDVNRAAAQLTWNENLTAVDDRGNIGYWHPGLLPIRPAGWDERLPYPGTGRAEWRGFLAVSQRPHVIDPAQGFLTNWNNVPSVGWTTQNNPASERLAGPFFRTAYLNLLVRGIVRRPTIAALENVVHREGIVAQQRPLDARRLAQAAVGARGGAAALLHTILAWDGSYDRADAHGLVDPGVAAWQAFKDAAQALSLAPLGAGARILAGGEPNEEHVFDVSWGQAYALEHLSPTGYRAAAASAYASLAQRLGPDPSDWRQPRTLVKQSSEGAEQPPPLPFYDRGTWEQLVELQG